MTILENTPRTMLPITADCLLVWVHVPHAYIVSTLNILHTSTGVSIIANCLQMIQLPWPGLQLQATLMTQSSVSLCCYRDCLEERFPCRHVCRVCGMLNNLELPRIEYDINVLSVLCSIFVDWVKNCQF